jgi:CheY-like chemotaxis protein
MMDGSISVESEYGKGSVFSIKILQKFVTDATIGPEMAKNLRDFSYYQQRRKRNSKLVRISLPYARVLLVDDVVTNLDIAKGLMKPYNMQIDCVTSGQEAIEAVRDSAIQYNAVFMDHMMPGMDGIEAARLIREIGTDYVMALPIIALTANAVVGNEEMFLNNGFQAFLPKPIEITRLDTVIRKWVRDKEQEKLYLAQQKELSGQEKEHSDSDKTTRIEWKSLAKKITDLDIEKGIKRFGYDEDSYFEVLRSYAVHTKQLLETIKEVNKDHLADYGIVVHGIKGSSRGICADALAQTAETLEKEAKAGNYDFIVEHNADFLETALKLVTDIEDMLEQISTDKPKQKKDKPNEDVLLKLYAACEKYDMDEVDAIMGELGSFEYETGGDLVTWLRDNVELMNFKQIVEKLSNMAEKKK